jgi:hypothetical protein
MQSPPLLGKLPAKSDPRTLMHARFIEAPKVLPVATNFWPKRAAFPLRTFGNIEFGSCTRASQALAAMRMERLECERTPSIKDDEVVRAYLQMTAKLYGGGDTGAFEIDALSCWRRADETFRDTKGNPLTIDAYLRINQADVQRIKEALFTAGAHGIKVCFNLPLAFQEVVPPHDWSIPAGKALVGEYLPGSWGGHSMFARDYDAVGVWLPHSWGLKDQRITWPAFAAYADEAYTIIDSVDAWRNRGAITKSVADKIKSAVNAVSDTKL